MNLIKKNGIIFFWALLFAHCALIYLEKTDYQHITKLMLIPILFIYLILNVKKDAYQTSKTIIYIGLFASFLGDLFLIFTGNGYFLAGMAAFLITHICYTIFFLKANNVKFNKATEFVIATIVVTIVAIKLLGFLKPYLGELALPVKIYMAAICIMTATAANLLGDKKLKNLGLTYFLPGALLFVLSDSVLAINMFLYKDTILKVVVMLSYGYAQCLIVQGFAKYLKA